MTESGHGTTASFTALRRSRVISTLQALIRTRITAGVITILPVLITFWVVSLIFVWMRDASGWAVKWFLLSKYGHAYLERLHFNFEAYEKIAASALNPQEHFFKLMPWHISWGVSIFSVFLTVFILYAIGLFAANIFGRRAILVVEQLVDRVPLIKTVYRGLKQILSNFSSESPQKFQRVALFPFMSPGIYSLGFITNTFKDVATGEEYVTMFFASTPNPTTGFVVIIKRSDIVELDWSMEDAVRAVMSGGLLLPSAMAVPQSLRFREYLTRPDLPIPVGPAVVIDGTTLQTGK